MKIIIETIPHKEQRYETTGDYWLEDNTLHIKVSEAGDWKNCMLVAIHELVEASLCMSDRVNFKSIDDFDIAHPELEDPGLDSRAPYHQQHMIATGIEILLCELLRVNWNDHNAVLEQLYEQEKSHQE